MLPFWVRASKEVLGGEEGLGPVWQLSDRRGGRVNLDRRRRGPLNIRPSGNKGPPAVPPQPPFYKMTS